MAATAAPSEAPGRQVEGHGGGRELRQMIDQQRPASDVDLGDRGQRHLAAAPARRHVDRRRANRRSSVGRGIRLDDDPVLVRLGEDGGDDALAERVVQRVVDRADADAEARRAVAVDGRRRPPSPLFSWLLTTSASSGCSRSAATSFGVQVLSAAGSALSRVN